MRVRRAGIPPLWLLFIAFSLAGASPAAEENAAAVETAEAAEVESVETEAEEEAAGAAQSVTDKLQGKEGVRIQTMCTHCNSANIQVGGLSQDLVPIYRNGYPVLGGLATSMVLSILPPDAIADAKVDKGPGSAMAGATAAGGTIRLTESIPSEVPHAEVTIGTGSYNEFSTEMRLAEQFNNWLSGMFTAGTTTADAVDDDGDGWNDVGAIERSYAEGQLRFDIGRNHELDFGVSWIEEDDRFGRGRWDALAYDWQNPDAFLGWVREDTAFDRLEYRGGWSWSLGKGRLLKLQYLEANRYQTVTAQETKRSIFAPELEQLRDRFLIGEKDRWHGVKYVQPIGLRWILRTGIEDRRNRLEADSLVALSVPPLYDPGFDHIRQSSAFAEMEWAPSPKWNLQAGIRYDDAMWDAYRYDLRTDEWEHKERSEEQASPRFTVRFRPTKDWTFRLLGGRTFRAPKPTMSEVCCGQEYQSSVDTLAETGESIGFETIFQPSPDLRANVYLASTDFDNYIMRIVGWSASYTQTYVMANVPRARAETAELALRWSPTQRVTLDASMGWLSFHNRGEEFVDVNYEFFGTLYQIPLPFGRIPYLPDRTASLSASITLPCGSIVSLGGAYTGEMLIQQFDSDNYLPGPPFGSILQQELRMTSDFWMVNLSAEIPLKHGMALLLAGNNLTGEIQSDLGDPTTDYNWGPLSGRSWHAGFVYRSK